MTLFSSLESTSFDQPPTKQLETLRIKCSPGIRQRTIRFLLGPHSGGLCRTRRKTDLREAGLMACLVQPVPCDLRPALPPAYDPGKLSYGAASAGAMTRKPPLGMLVRGSRTIRRSVPCPTVLRTSSNAMLEIVQFGSR